MYASVPLQDCDRAKMVRGKFCSGGARLLRRLEVTWKKLSPYGNLSWNQLIADNSARRPSFYDGSHGQHSML
jgi:hypothetical protein